jgi:hypothetical protein
MNRVIFVFFITIPVVVLSIVVSLPQLTTSPTRELTALRALHVVARVVLYHGVSTSTVPSLAPKCILRLIVLNHVSLLFFRATSVSIFLTRFSLVNIFLAMTAERNTFAPLACDTSIRSTHSSHLFRGGSVLPGASNGTAVLKV